MSQVRFEQLLVLWEDGDRRLKHTAPGLRGGMGMIVDAIVLELRRRLGGPFSAEDLADLYLEGTDWCFELATQVRPGEPETWDMPTVVGAAFARYVRRARDFGGGRRWSDDDPRS